MLRNTVTLILVLLGALTALALPVGSFRTEEVKGGDADTNAVRKLIRLSSHYLEKDQVGQPELDSALFNLKQAVHLAILARKPTILYEAKMYLGAYYNQSGDTSKGSSYFIEAINYFKSHRALKLEATAWYKWAQMPRSDDHVLANQIRYFQNSYVLFRQLGDRLSAIGVAKEIADSHIHQGKIQLAKSELLSVLAQYQAAGYKKLQFTYDLLAAISQYEGDMKKTLAYRLAVIKSMQLSGDSTFAGSLYNNLGYTYQDMGNIEQSIVWYKKALTYAKWNKEFDACYVLMNNIESLYITTGDYQRALSFINLVVKDIPPKSVSQKMFLYSAYGDCYAALKQYALAKTNFKKLGIEFEILNRETVDIRKAVETYCHIGSFYIDIGDYRSAKIYLNKLIKIPISAIELPKQETIQHIEFKIDSAAGHYLSAIKHANQRDAFRDAIFNEKRDKQVHELAVQYETSQKEQAIKLLESGKKADLAKLQKVALERNLTLGGTFAFFIIAGLAYNGYRIKKYSNQLLNKQQKEINAKNSSLEKLLNQKDQLLSDKNLLIKEVHHRVKNNLHIVMSLLESQSAYLHNDAALTAILESQNRVQAIALIHQKLYNAVNNTEVDMQSYIPELIEYLDGSINTKTHQIVISHDIQPVTLDVSQAIPVGIILNEAITNAIKYAFPGDKRGEINVSMAYAGAQITLCVRDNGNGPPVDFEMIKARSLGMNLMKGLTSQLKGTFLIKYADGVHISIEFIREEMTV